MCLEDLGGNVEGSVSRSPLETLQEMRKLVILRFAKIISSFCSALLFVCLLLRPIGNIPGRDKKTLPSITAAPHVAFLAQVQTKSFQSAFFVSLSGKHP